MFEEDDIEITSPVRRVEHPAFAGRAISASLNETPSQEWRTEFGKWPQLSKYFARIQIEGETLILYLGNRGRGESVSEGLDEVQKAIEAANSSRRKQIQQDIKRVAEQR